MNYERIRNLSEDDRSLASPELAALGVVWRERKESIAAEGSLDSFQRKLEREWAIETGLIERLYQWDRGVTEVLIQQGIDAALIAHHAGISEAKAHHAKDLIDDQQSTIEGLFEFVKGDLPLSEHYIRSLHGALTRHQDSTTAVTPEGRRIEVELRKGVYKQHPNNPRRQDGTVHEYCPPEIVQDEMQNLVAWFREAQDTTAPEVLAAWLHHLFTQIHPFQDGNGRVARALATLVFLKAEMFPLVIRDTDRDAYLDVLETADRGDLAGLVELFARRQKEAILQAMTLEREVRRDQQIDLILGAAISSLKRQRDARTAEFSRVFDVARELEDEALSRVEELERKISEQIRPLAVGGERYHASASICKNEEDKSHYYLREIYEIARQLGYFANTSLYRAWVRLVIQTRDPFYFLVSFHGLGHAFEGVLVASAFVFRRADDEEGKKTQVVELRPATGELFQLNYAESPQSTQQRFALWLQDAMTLAMAEWQRSISV